MIRRFSCCDTCVCVCVCVCCYELSCIFSFLPPSQCSLWVCVCVFEGVKKHIMFLSPGNHDQPNSLRSLVMQLFLYRLPHRVPPAVHQMWLMAGSLQHNICWQPSKCIPAFVFLGFYLQVFCFFLCCREQTHCYEILWCFFVTNVVITRQKE